MTKQIDDVKSAARTLDILELLAEFPQGLSLTEVGKHLHIPLSSLHGLINTLANREYVIRNELTMLYCLGPRLAQTAVAYQPQSDLVSFADPVMDRIRRITGETTSLTILQGNIVIFIHKRPAEGRLQVYNPVGTRLPAHATGSGKIMLTYLTDEEIDLLYPEESLPAITPNTITTKSALKAALAEARDKGYAYDDEESEIGVWAVAGCIRSGEGRPLAAISVVAPHFRIRSKEYQTWYEYIREGAAEITSNLKFE